MTGSHEVSGSIPLISTISWEVKKKKLVLETKRAFSFPTGQISISNCHSALRHGRSELFRTPFFHTQTEVKQLDQAVTFSYFYGVESEQFSYYRIPRLLVTGEQFRGLSTDAKLLYGLLLDRIGLSAKHGWYDDQGRVFIYYPLEEIQDALNCAHGKAVKLLSELDAATGIGLIERVRQGQGKPAKIYVKQFTTKEVPPLPAPDDSRLPKSGSLNFR